MIIYIPLLFSFYSLCFPTTPKPKVVLTPGLEQTLIFFFIPLIINNLYTKPRVCIFNILLQTSHSFLGETAQARSRGFYFDNLLPCKEIKYIHKPSSNRFWIFDRFLFQKYSSLVYLMYTNINLNSRG